MKTNSLTKVSQSVGHRLIHLAIVTAAPATNQYSRRFRLTTSFLPKTKTRLRVSRPRMTDRQQALPVTLQAPDQWLVTFPTTVSFGSAGRNVDWIEPGNSSLGNAVSFFPEVSNVLGVSSDTGVTPSFSPTPDGSIVSNVGSDSRGGSISATFDDDGDARAVPEAGSTFGLLLLGLIGLSGASRLCSVRSV